MKTAKAASVVPARLRAKEESFPKSKIIALGCAVAVACYAAAKVGDALLLRPERVCPLWPGCAVLVAVLLSTPRKLWKFLVLAGIAGFVICDFQKGLALRPIILLNASDLVEVLFAAFAIQFAIGGKFRLTSVRSLSKYLLVAVFLAPLFGSLIGSLSSNHSYWLSWKISLLANSLAFLTLTPAILGYASLDRSWKDQSTARYVEMGGLAGGFIILGIVTFQISNANFLPGLLFSLVPFLLWAALRFGVTGISTSMVFLAFLSIWSAVRQQGPFRESPPLEQILPLQLFLLFAATPFLFLATLAEQRSRTDQSLRESEERFRRVANTAPVMIWTSGVNKLCNYFNQGWLNFTGRPIESEIGNGWAEGVHPEDFNRCLEVYTKAFDLHEEFRMEYRLRRHDGEYRCVLDHGVPRFSPDGSFSGYIGSAVDITEARDVHEMLASLNRRLIEAQEADRARIARDLHDDIGQQLVLLAIEAGQLNSGFRGRGEETTRRIARVQGQISDIAARVHELSHQLHSSSLKNLGLVAAARSYCRELSEQQRAEIGFKGDAFPDRLPSEVSLCLFRVLQEALQNAIKHSGVAHFEVELAADKGFVQLTVSDLGAGFDSDAALKGTGLGLVSMRERLKLVNGELLVSSMPRAGTTIRARVPVAHAAGETRPAV